MSRKRPREETFVYAPTPKRQKTSVVVTPMAMQVDTNPVFKSGMKRRRSVRGPRLSKRQKFEVLKVVHRERELKFFGTVLNNSASTTTATVSSISDVTQGDTDTTRDGDRLTWCGHLEFRYSWILGTVDPKAFVRVLIFQWHPNTTPTASSVLLTGASGSIDVYSQYSHDNRQMFCILYDKVTNLTGNAATTINYTSISEQYGVQHIRLKPVASFRSSSFQSNVQFSTGTTTGTNKIYLLHISSTNNAGGAGDPHISYTTKLVYRDG